MLALNTPKGFLPVTESEIELLAGVASMFQNYIFLRYQTRSICKLFTNAAVFGFRRWPFQLQRAMDVAQTKTARRDGAAREPATSIQIQTQASPMAERSNL